MKQKTNPEHRTLTRARLDAAVYTLFLKLHDGKPRAIAAAKFIRQLNLGTELLEDLRTLGRLTSTGNGKGQRHAWTGAPPTSELVDGIEQLREARAAKKAERLREKQAQQATKNEEQTITQRSPWASLEQALSLTDNLNILLDIRNCVDARLRELPPPTLFDTTK